MKQTFDPASPPLANVPALSCRGIVYSYCDCDILRGVDLELANGELGVIFGRSASGKTTLLRCITGYLQPASGTIDSSGSRRRAADFRGMALDESAIRLMKLWKKLDAHRTDCREGPFYSQPAAARMMFADDANILPQLTAEENVHFAVAPICSDAALRRDLVGELLAIVGLSGVRLHRPAELSSGQQRRLSLAQSLVCNPPFLALDEPTSALDTGTKFDILRLVQDLHRAIGLTGLVVTHDIDSVLLLADVVFRLSGGRIVSTDRIVTLQPRRSEDLAREELVSLRQELVDFVSNTEECP